MCLSGPGSQAGPRQSLLLREVTSTTIRHTGAHRYTLPVSVCACLRVSTHRLNIGANNYSVSERMLADHLHM